MEIEPRILAHDILLTQYCFAIRDFISKIIQEIMDCLFEDLIQSGRNPNPGLRKLLLNERERHPVVIVTKRCSGLHDCTRPWQAVRPLCDLKAFGSPILRSAL